MFKSCLKRNNAASVPNPEQTAASTPNAPAASAGNRPETQQEKLDRQHRQGLLNDEEYARETQRARDAEEARKQAEAQRNSAAAAEASVLAADEARRRGLSELDDLLQRGVITQKAYEDRRDRLNEQDPCLFRLSELLGAHYDSCDDLLKAWDRENFPKGGDWANARRTISENARREFDSMGTRSMVDSAVASVRAMFRV